MLQQAELRQYELLTEAAGDLRHRDVRRRQRHAAVLGPKYHQALARRYRPEGVEVIGMPLEGEELLRHNGLIDRSRDEDVTEPIAQVGRSPLQRLEGEHPRLLMGLSRVYLYPVRACAVDEVELSLPCLLGARDKLPADGLLQLELSLPPLGGSLRAIEYGRTELGHTLIGKDLEEELVAYAIDIAVRDGDLDTSCCHLSLEALSVSSLEDELRVEGLDAAGA